MMEPNLYQPQTVTSLTHSLKGLLEASFPFVTVVGEVSNLRRPFSGHWYFTLKDNNAQIRAVFFKLQQRYLAATPTDGMQIICRGRISVYEPRGEYQLIVDSIQFHGEGALQAAFEELKKRLALEGLFGPEHKKPIPPLPDRIALVTSPTGAAVRDFLKIAANRFPLIPIEIYPVRVQGIQAIDDIVEALAALNMRKSSEVIVLCRGGGSIEDLCAFNDEKVARAIFQSRIPVVSAIGHEIDFTIADFVADLRTPTPSAAAEALLPDRKAIAAQIVACRKRLVEATQRKNRNLQKQIDSLRRYLGDPTTRLTHFFLLLDHRQERLSQAMNAILVKKKMRLEKQDAVLSAVNPRAVLERGYAFVMDEKETGMIRDSRQVHPGDIIRIHLHKGEIEGEVTRIIS